MSWCRKSWSPLPQPWLKTRAHCRLPRLILKCHQQCHHRHSLKSWRRPYNSNRYNNSRLNQIHWLRSIWRVCWARSRIIWRSNSSSSPQDSKLRPSRCLTSTWPSFSNSYKPSRSTNSNSNKCSNNRSSRWRLKRAKARIWTLHLHHFKPNRIVSNSVKAISNRFKPFQHQKHQKKQERRFWQRNVP